MEAHNAVNNQALAHAGLPQITALIPAYNRAHLLPRALESVLAQSRVPDEIIVVDDGSADDTAAVVAGYGERVRYLYQENAGSAAARHTGMLAASHPWVALLDSDDVWVPDYLERIAQAIVGTGGRAGYYFADTRRTAQEGYASQWEMTGFAIDAPFVLAEDASDWVLAPRQPMMLQASVINREAYLACGGFWKPLRYRDDTHLFIKLGLSGPVCAVAGGGAEMHDDDAPQNRLSATYNQARRGKEMQVLMNEELLDYFGEALTPAQEGLLTQRLAQAYLGLARLAWSKRDPGDFTRNIWLTLRTRPAVLAELVRRKTT